MYVTVPGIRQITKIQNQMNVERIKIFIKHEHVGKKGS